MKQVGTIVMATRNADKLRELVPILSSSGIAIETLDDAGIAEDHDAELQIEAFETFEENARAKATCFARLLPGRIVLADDSGLVVDALGGAPGVRSKRWSSPIALHDGSTRDTANNTRLLAELAAVGAMTDVQRSARYVCAMAYAHADLPSAIVVIGVCEGFILQELRGSNGFGYDPLFWSVDLQQSFGESSREDKSAVSHRGRALQALLPELEKSFSG